jgi:hypothetical protein
LRRCLSQKVGGSILSAGREQQHTQKCQNQKQIRHTLHSPAPSGFVYSHIKQAKGCDEKQGKQEHSDDGNGSQSLLPQQLSVDTGQDEAKNGTNKQNDSVSPADAKIINAAGAGIIGKVVQKTVDINDAVDTEYDRKKQDEARYDQQYEGECSFH